MNPNGNLTGRRRRLSGPDHTSTAASPSINLDLITSDQYAQVYVDHLFSDKGPVAELENYFNKASNYMRTLILEPKCTNKAGMKDPLEQCERGRLKDQAEGTSVEQTVDKGKDDKQGEMMECNQRDESLKLSIVETQPEESLHNVPNT